MGRTCAECGAENHAGHRRCWICREPLRAAAEAPAPNGPAASSKPEFQVWMGPSGTDGREPRDVRPLLGTAAVALALLVVWFGAFREAVGLGAFVSLILLPALLLPLIAGGGRAAPVARTLMRVFSIVAAITGLVAIAGFIAFLKACNDLVRGSGG